MGAGHAEELCLHHWEKRGVVCSRMPGGEEIHMSDTMRCNSPTGVGHGKDRNDTQKLLHQYHVSTYHTYKYKLKVDFMLDYVTI